MTTTPTTQFEIGETYTAQSAADHTCVWEFTVIERTKNFITVTDNDKERRIGVKLFGGVEWAMPLGRYSMAPVIRATRKVVTV